MLTFVKTLSIRNNQHILLELFASTIDSCIKKSLFFHFAYFICCHSQKVVHRIFYIFLWLSSSIIEQFRKQIACISFDIWCNKEQSSSTSTSYMQQFCKALHLFSKHVSSLRFIWKTEVRFNGQVDVYVSVRNVQWFIVTDRYTFGILRTWKIE